MASTLARIHQLYYSDNFVRDATLLSLPAADQMWETVAGTWILGTSLLPRQGCLTHNSEAARGIVKVKFSDGYQADGSVSADLITTSASGANTAVAGLLFHYASATSYYFAIIGRDGTVAVYKRSGASDSLVGSAASSHSPLRAHSLRVSMAGGTFKVYVDGGLALTCTDASPISSGPAGLLANSSKAQFRAFMWYNDIEADKGRAWAEFMTNSAPDSESPPVGVVKIPGGIGSRIQAGMGTGERTYRVEGTVLSGFGALQTRVGAASGASFQAAVDNLRRSNLPVAVITPHLRTTGYIKDLAPSISPFRNSESVSFTLLEYFKNSS